MRSREKIYLSNKEFSKRNSFEIGMIEGCEGGEIIAGGIAVSYFYDAEQPFMFMASAEALKKIDPLVNSYFLKNYDIWKKEKGFEPFDRTKRKQDEDQTQSHPEVQTIWGNYIKSLEVLYPSKYKKCK